MPEPPRRTLRPVTFPVRLLADPRHARTMHSALWLYLVLRAAAAPDTGRLQVAVEDLARVLDLKPAAVSSLLGRLRTHGYVETRRVHGQLEIRIVDWTPTAQSSPPSPRPIPEPDHASGLALEIATAFGDVGNLARYEDLVERFPEALVRQAFREARLMPRARVRKSRGALFTFLLKNYADTNDSEESDTYDA